jgi:phage gp36-like protein
MAYCTQTDITNRKGTKLIAELTGDPAGATINTGSVTLAINEMGEILDAAVRKRYPDLPFDSSNNLLKGLNVQGAYLILERDSRSGWDDDHREDWKLLMEQVRSIANGTLDLRTETEEQEEAAVEGFFSSKARLFGRNSLSGEEVATV